MHVHTLRVWDYIRPGGELTMYLLIVNDEPGKDRDHGVKRIIYHWFHPGRNDRDLREYLVKQLGPGAFLVKEDNYAMRSINWMQSRHGSSVIEVYRLGKPIRMNDEFVLDSVRVEES